ncbi:MAG TPA: Hpt domain-containing protein [Baekduia sp.]|uniref:Hpt domain-containing protein n=1 Tax=Baekduia sp. TaxID=2600305 RepID=UPI002D79163C|nr:Hpt domain-containing protein [Baekduia sp.]HET6507507.1 Hpt domain-containing protein [Baekduia sp.]
MGSDSVHQTQHHAQLALDPNAIAALRDLLGHDAHALREIIDEFLCAAPDCLAELRSAVASGDAEAAARAAHTLKANAATFGAVALADRCRAVEAQARSGPGTADLAQVDAIAAEWVHVDAGLRAVRPGAA